MASNAPSADAIARLLDGDAPELAAPVGIGPECLPGFAELWPQVLAARSLPSQAGQSTHFPRVDDIFRWVPGKVIGWTGWPGHGKTEFVFQLALAKGLLSGWNWAAFSPEAMTPIRLVNQWVETWTGYSTNTDYRSCLTPSQHENALRGVLDVMQPIVLEGTHDLDSVLAAAELHIQRRAALGLPVNGLILDPWNAMDHDLGRLRDDQFVRQAVTKCGRFAKKYGICLNIIIHPTGEARTRDGELKEPDQYSMEGGRMWAKRLDDVMMVHRPNLDTNPKDTAVKVTSLKIKDHKFSGCMPGSVMLDYIRKFSRYYQKDGHNPLPPVGADSRADSAGDAPPPPEPYRPYANLPAPTAFATAPDTHGWPLQ